MIEHKYFGYMDEQIQIGVSDVLKLIREHVYDVPNNAYLEIKREGTEQQLVVHWDKKL